MVVFVMVAILSKFCPWFSRHGGVMVQYVFDTVGGGVIGYVTMLEIYLF